MNLFRAYNLLSILLLLLPSYANAFLSGGAKPADPKADFRKFSDCNWLVVYRGRTYDLAPLTKGSLSRPLDSDMRSILSLYPEAKQHLDLADRNAHDAKMHTIIASGSLLGAVVSSLLRSHSKTRDEHDNFSVLTVALSGFFVKGIFSSWRASDAAKEELSEAVSTFNEISPYKIEAAGSSAVLP